MKIKSICSLPVSLLFAITLTPALQAVPMDLTRGSLQGSYQNEGGESVQERTDVLAGQNQRSEGLEDSATDVIEYHERIEIPSATLSQNDNNGVPIVDARAVVDPRVIPVPSDLRTLLPHLVDGDIWSGENGSRRPTQRELVSRYADYVQGVEHEEALSAEINRVSERYVSSGKAEEERRAQEERNVWEAVRDARAQERAISEARLNARANHLQAVEKLNQLVAQQEQNSKNIFGFLKAPSLQAIEDANFNLARAINEEIESNQSYRKQIITTTADGIKLGDNIIHRDEYLNWLYVEEDFLMNARNFLYKEEIAKSRWFSRASTGDKLAMRIQEIGEIASRGETLVSILRNNGIGGEELESATQALNFWQNFYIREKEAADRHSLQEAEAAKIETRSSRNNSNDYTSVEKSIGAQTITNWKQSTLDDDAEDFANAWAAFAKDHGAK